MDGGGGWMEETSFAAFREATYSSGRTLGSEEKGRSLSNFVAITFLEHLICVRWFTYIIQLTPHKTLPDRYQYHHSTPVQVVKLQSEPGTILLLSRCTATQCLWQIPLGIWGRGFGLSPPTTHSSWQQLLSARSLQLCLRASPKS